MKKLIIIALLIAGGYYLYNHNERILGDIRPSEMGSSSSAAARAGGRLPQKTPERSCRINMPRGNFNALENAAFGTYDQRAAFALVELTYTAGMDEAAQVITRYLSVFTIPEDRWPVLTLVSKFRDRESLDMLNRFLTNGTFPRRTVLNNIAAFKNAEAAAIIRDAMGSQNAAIRSAADAVFEEVKNEPWFTAVNL